MSEVSVSYAIRRGFQKTTISGLWLFTKPYPNGITFKRQFDEKRILFVAVAFLLKSIAQIR